MTPISSLVQFDRKVKSEVFGVITLYIQSHEEFDSLGVDLGNVLPVETISEEIHFLNIHNWHVDWEDAYDETCFGVITVDVSMCVDTDTENAILACNYCLSEINANITNIKVDNGLFVKVNDFEIDWLDVYTEQIEEVKSNVSRRRTGAATGIHLVAKRADCF